MFDIDDECFECYVCGVKFLSSSDIYEDIVDYENYYPLDEFTAIWWRCSNCGTYHLDEDYQDDHVAIESIKRLNENR